MQHIALVVDDDRHTLIFMEQALRPIGVSVMLTEDGARAIDVLQAYTPSIVFLDLLMPQVSGFEVLDFITQTPRLNDTYVVIVTAHQDFGDVPQLARADQYLVKPVRIKELRELVRFVIERQVTG
jgi:CheY-like chemotaxis protein